MRYDLVHIILVLITLVFCNLFFGPSDSFAQDPPTIITVIVDPGHGGQDEGAKGSCGILEKQITLALARKLTQELKETGTVRPILTRTDDYSISLDDRAGLANHRGGDLFISLHLGNSFLPVPMGFSLYYWSPVTAAPTSPPISQEKTPWDQENRPYLERSRRLATLMQQNLQETLQWPTGGVLAADLYLLRRVKMPAVLVELGSLNHPEEAAQLQKLEFQESIVRAITETIIQYREEQVKEALGER